MSLTDLRQRIIDSIENLTTLETVTVVGGIDYDPARGWGHAAEAGGAAVGMLTKKRLLDGDVTTVIHPDLLTGDLAALRAFHLEREKAGDLVVETNLAAVKALFELATNLLRDEQGQRASVVPVRSGAKA
jgi:hypothetical protein